MGIESINPTTGEVLRRFEPHGAAEVERRVAAARQASLTWRETAFSQRSALLGRAAGLLDSEKRRWAQIMTVEMGKPINASAAEVEKCASACRFYAENAERFLADEPVETDASTSFVRYQPLGPVLAIMPWNFPFWQVFRFAAPALMAGNVGLLKHASNVPQCALAIEEIFARAGFPAGTFQALLIPGSAAEALVSDERIRAVTLTGSDAAGAAVGRAAGGEVKKVVLELGGSDPFLVMPGADLGAAVSTAVKARTINNGQSCIAAKRFLLHRELADEFERGFVEKMGKLKVGDPMDPEVEIGPLATRQIRDQVHEQVEATVAKGAKRLLGGRPIDGPGNFYAPTVLSEVPPGSPGADEEIFGPVASLFRFSDLEEGIALANRTRYGLGASVWTSDAAERQRLIDGIESGSVFVNGMVKSDPRLPFGGVKKSGHGRELSHHGIHEFVNVKTVWVA